MQPTHPIRFDQLLTPGDVATADGPYGYLRTVSAVIEMWKENNGVIYDIGDIPEQTFDWADKDKFDFYTPEDAFYVHLGPEYGLQFDRNPDLFVEGIYFVRAADNGVIGTQVMIVTNEKATYGQQLSHEEVMRSHSRVLLGWGENETGLVPGVKATLQGDTAMRFDNGLDRVLDEINPILLRICAMEKSVKFTGKSLAH